MDEVKQMAPGWEHYLAMSDVFPALLEVVEQQHRALKGLHDDNADYLRLNNLGGYDNHWMVAARAALSLMDKENAARVANESMRIPGTNEYWEGK